MRFFANLRKRVPVRHGVPTLLAVLALAGIFDHATLVLQSILELLGGYWG